MKKVVVGSMENVDRRFKIAYNALAEYTGKAPQNAAYVIGKDESYTINLVNGDTEREIVIPAMKWPGFTMYLGDCVIVVVHEDEDIDIFLHEMCHLFSRNDKCSGINCEEYPKVVLVNEGITNFFTKRIYKEITGKKYDTFGLIDVELIALCELYVLLENDCNVEHLAQMYFHSDISYFNKEFCIKVFGCEYKDLAKTLDSMEYSTILYYAARNIFRRNRKKLLDKRYAKKVRRILKEYSVRELNQAYCYIYRRALEE